MSEDVPQPDSPGDRVREDAATARTLISAALLKEITRRVREYENMIDWHTSCTACARTLDSFYAETVRREAAEARLAAIEAPLTGPQCDRLHQMVTGWGDALAAVRRGLELAAGDDAVVAAAWAGLKVLESGEEDGDDWSFTEPVL